MKWILVAVSLCAVTLSAGMASAAPAAKKVVLAGPANPVRIVEVSLGKAVTAVKQGPLPDDVSAATLTDLAQLSNAVAVLTVHEDATSVTVDVFNAADGASLAHTSTKKKGLKVLPKPVVATLTKAIASAKPAAAKPAPTEVKTTPKPDSTTGTGTTSTTVATSTTPVKTTPEPTPEPKPTTENAHELFQAGVNARLMRRSLSWKDDLFSKMPPYSLPLGPAFGVWAELYPLSLVTKGALSGLGVAASFENSVGITSVDADGEKYATSAMRFRAGLLYSLPVSVLTLKPQVGWAMQSYTFAALSTNMVPRVNVPNVRYGTVRMGLDVGVQVVGPLSLVVGGAYQLVLDSGQIGSSAYFPHATVGGADFSLAVALRLIEHLEVKLGIEYQRYWYSLHPNPGDPWIVGGALDEFQSVNLGVSWVM